MWFQDRELGIFLDKTGLLDASAKVVVGHRHCHIYGEGIAHVQGRGCGAGADEEVFQ